MRRRGLLWQVYAPYLIIIILSLLAITWYASRSLRQFYLDRTRSDLEARARLVEKYLAPHLSETDAPIADAVCKELGKKSSTRITVILPTGKVIGDSEEDPARMDNHSDRPEVAGALEGRTGVSTRYSHTLNKHMMYVAILVVSEGTPSGVVRTSIPITDIEKALRSVYSEIVLGGLAIALVSALVSLGIVRRIRLPLEEMRRGAECFAKGELDHKLLVPDTREVASLAEAMNQMAAQLDARIRSAIRQSNEQEAVLSSMVEGVLAVDMEERLISMNQAASRLIELDPSRARGRTVQEVVRNTQLQRFVRQALAGTEQIESEIVLHKDGERFLQARGTILRDTQGRCSGAVIVLRDTTDLKRLEHVRRDFVANVSHELKTPITSIKGFVETLLAGAIGEPGDAERFLGIIAKETDRLNAIVEDLLSLSKIEQETEKKEIVLEKGSVGDVIQAAIQDCELKAAAKKIEIQFGCREDVQAEINAALLEQAVVNLIDNAIKYSEPRSKVEVNLNLEGEEIVISVRDEGCGIESRHLPRIFERFYRVDRARSRKMGGTGLGLAIVKHIAQAHRGRVAVESAPGRGSDFRIFLPKT